MAENPLQQNQKPASTPKMTANPQKQENGKENKFLKGFEKGLDMLGTAGGGSLLTAPFRVAKVVKDSAKGIYKGITAPTQLEEKRNQALYQKAQKQKLANQQKQVQQAQKLKMKEDLKAAKEKQRQQLAMEKGQTKDLQSQFKKNVVKGTPNQAMQQLFPTSFRKEPVGIKNPMIPKPGEKYQVDKTSPTGTVPITLKRPKPRMTQKRKLNQKIGQGLANPTSYEDKIKKIMGVE